MSRKNSGENTTSVDPYRAQRELERWLFKGGNEREISEAMSKRGSSSDWEEGASIAFIIEYAMKRDDNGNIVDADITYHRPKGLTKETLTVVHLRDNVTPSHLLKRFIKCKVESSRSVHERPPSISPTLKRIQRKLLLVYIHG